MTRYIHTFHLIPRWSAYRRNTPLLSRKMSIYIYIEYIGMALWHSKPNEKNSILGLYRARRVQRSATKIIRYTDTAGCVADAIRDKKIRTKTSVRIFSPQDKCKCNLCKYNYGTAKNVSYLFMRDARKNI